MLMCEKIFEKYYLRNIEIAFIDNEEEMRENRKRYLTLMR